MMEAYPDQVKDIAGFLNPYSSRNFETQRITVVAIFAEMIDHCKVRWPVVPERRPRSRTPD